VRKEMASEPAAIWFVPAEGTDTHAILLKSPSNILKAVIQGCPIEIVFGITEIEGERMLCTATKIYDDTLSPFIISGAQKCREEQVALIEILRRNTTPLFLYDELSRCTSWAEATFDQTKVNIVLSLIGNEEYLYAGTFNDNVSYALDCIDLAVDPTRIIEGATKIPTVNGRLSFSEFQHTDLTAIGVHESYQFNIGDSNEGRGFEHTVWHLLESLFPLQIYKSPQIKHGNVKRELTDIL